MAVNNALESPARTARNPQLSRPHSIISSKTLCRRDEGTGLPADQVSQTLVRFLLFHGSERADIVGVSTIIDGHSLRSIKGIDFVKVRGLTWICRLRSEERRVGKECRSRWSP